MMTCLIWLLNCSCPYSATHLNRWQRLSRSNLLLLQSQQLVLFRNRLRKSHNRFLVLSTNMCDRILHNFDATFSIVCNNIASNIWLTMLSKYYNAIKSALLNLVTPNQRHWARLIVITDYLYAVFVGLRDRVIKQFRFVILNFNTDATNLNLILHNICIDVFCRDDGWALTEPDLVTLNLWLRFISLNENASCLATHYYIFRYNNIIFRFCVHHNCTGIEVSKRAFMDRGITPQRQNTSGERFLKCITFKIAMENLQTCIRLRNNTRYFFVSFSRAAIQR